MKSIPNRACGYKRRHALTLPNFTATDVPGDASTFTAYDALRRRFREWVTTENVRARLAHQKAETEYLTLRPCIVKDAIRLNLGTDFDVSTLGAKETPLFTRYLALNLTLDRETARIGAIDEALAGYPHCAFLQFIGDHDDDDLQLHDAMISEMLGELKEVVYTAETLAARFEQDLVELVNRTKDRLAVVTQMLLRYAPPSISDEEIEQEPSLALVRRHWEKGNRALYQQLEGEKEVWEEMLATQGLETTYWWARGISEGLDDCAVVLPSLALILDQWRRQGIAGAEITVDAIWEELFKVEEES